MPWAQLKSQPRVSDLLQRSMKRGRLHHAYLFMGDESETEPLALALAQALNCDVNNGDFCGVCRSCVAIAKGQHPDVHAIRPESKSRRIVISQVRELERSVYLKATSARTKIAIVHAADRLQPEAQDAFLKTLEEPPNSTTFVLLTSEAQQLRDTIISRCLGVPFKPGSRKEKSDLELKLEGWLSDFTAPADGGESTIIRAFGFSGQLLSLLKEVRDEKLKAAEAVLDQPSYDNLESSQRQKLEEEIAAQAQADYLHERSRVLKLMLEWFHQRKPNPKIVLILEKLARRLNRNVNESLSWELAMIELVEVL